MSYAIVFYIVGWVLKFESYFLMLPLIVSLIYHENNFFAYLLVAAVCFLSGSLLTRNKPKNAKLYPRDGFVCVALSWILKDDHVTSVLIGASKPEQILDNIGIIGHTSFSKEELDKIDAIVK